MSLNSQMAVRRWWGERWVGVLDEAGAASARRVQRGLALARRGAVDEIRLLPGRVVGRVQEDRTQVHEVEIDWPVAGDDAWERLGSRAGRQLRFTAALLDGELTPEVEQLFAEAGVPLFPRIEQLTYRCTCDERSTVCRHGAALHLAAATLVDRDPTVLLRLRGRGRDQLLRRVRDAGGEASQVSVDPTRDLGEARGDLEAIGLHPAPVDDPAATLLHLGPPPGVDDVRALAELVERAADLAWRLAAGAGAAAADEELLLSELRAQRVASAASLAEALGRDPEEVRDELDRLFEAGDVMRTGRGARARYRAAG